jgi:mRNA-degrading endonuclease toxin of MazEF toxin-antitoxin module
VVDQPRTVDRRRIERIAGELPEATVRAVLSKLREMFEE